MVIVGEDECGAGGWGVLRGRRGERGRTSCCPEASLDRLKGQVERRGEERRRGLKGLEETTGGSQRVVVVSERKGQA